jgi:CRP-like cAMP-binding protein
VTTGYAELMTTFPLFHGYTARGTQSLIERGQLRDCEAGHVLFNQGELASVVVLVLVGAVEHFVARPAGEIRLGHAGPSHVLADVQVVAGVEHPASARAMEATVILEWDSPAFRRLIASDTLFAQRVMNQTAQSLALQAESLIASMAALKEGSVRPG